ncbi:MAG: HIT domain-containing protein [Planctomycetes bacterium]|nr:HIT domain-containing protein [Planctomycetota bacterium]
MKRLWAPWRMKYIEEIPKTDGCFLCEAAEAGEAGDENLVVWREDLALCVMNRYPYNNGHLLVAPCRHEGEIGSLCEEERAALFGGLVRAKDLLQKVMSPDGFNIGLNLGRVAGAGLESHLHFHVVPRWNGDTNFMPVLADTKVIPEALSDLCGKLKGALKG